MSIQIAWSSAAQEIRRLVFEIVRKLASDEGMGAVLYRR